MAEKESAKPVNGNAAVARIRQENIPVVGNLRELHDVKGNIAICDGSTFLRVAGIGGWQRKDEAK